MVGDLPGGDARLPGPARGRQCRGMAGHDRASQGHRRAPGPQAAARAGRGRTRVADRARRAGRWRRRPVAGDRGTAGETAPSGGVSLHRRAGVRRDRRDPRRHDRCGTQGRGRWRQEPAEELPRRDHGRSAIMNISSDYFASPSDAETLLRLRDRLGLAADAEGLLDIAYTTIDSPVGTLLLAATPKGLVRVAYEIEDHDRVLDTLAQRLSPRVLRAPKRLDPAARELDEYFGRQRRVFDVPLDLSLSKGFRQLVQRHLPEIGYGQTRTYKQVAELVGNPKAFRAVGTACATNPLPVVVPCHRVLPASGASGGYVGGPDAKKALLSLEAAA